MRRDWLGLLLLAAFGTTSCDSTDPGTGSPGGLSLVTSTAGIQPDADGYTILVDGTAAGTIGSNDSLTVEGLDPGSHAVELGDIEFNCATLGQFTRTISLASDAGAVVDYDVACDAVERSRIAFVRYPQPSVAEVTLMNADGSGLVSLEDSLGVAVPELNLPSVSWSSDGSRMAFTRLDGVLLATTGEGGDAVQLAPLGLWPKWSGDGRQVVFMAPDVLGQPCCWDIFVAESDGSGVRQLTNGLSLDWYDFAENGSLIVYPTDPVTTRSLSFIRPDGTGYREFAVPGISFYQLPSLSPDGSKVAYTGYPVAQGPDGSGYEVYVSSTDGSGVAVNVSNNPGEDWWPVWSPSGDRIAFVSAPPGAGFGLGSIHVVNPDGTDQITLSPPDMGVWQPAWSPEGTRIAYTGSVGSDPHVFVANADGSGRNDITPDVPASLPTWTGR